MSHTHPAKNDAQAHGSGEHTLEVVALYAGTPRGVHHLRSPSSGRIRPLSAAMLAMGLLLAVGGAIAFFSQIWSVRRQVAHRARVIEFIKERGLPEKFAPAVRSRPQLEVGGAAAFAAGLFLLMFGGFRVREERRPACFRIGEDPRADYPAPSAGLPSPCFSLVSADGQGYRAHFTPAMEGEVTYPDGSVVALPDLARQGLAPLDAATASYAWPIPEGATCRVELGASVFRLRAVPRGEGVDEQPLSKRALAALSSPLSLSTVGSASVLGAFLLLMQLSPAGSDSLEADSVSDTSHRRIRELQKSAERDRAAKPKPERPKPPKTPPRTAQRTDPKAPRTPATHVDERFRAVATNATRPGVGSGPSQGDARRAGIAGVLSSPSLNLSSMFSRDSAISRDAEDSLAALTGHTYGSGDPLDGLGEGGRAGNPNGAGGISLGGSPFGKIGKGGEGAFQNGVPMPGGVAIGPRVPGHKPGQPVVFPDSRAEVLEGIDGDTIKRVIRRYLNQIRYCYQSRGLATNPRLAGEVRVAFLITGQGKVVKAQIASSTLHSPSTEQCIVSHVYGWRFPKSTGRTAYVKYPFRFRPSGGR